MEPFRPIVADLSGVFAAQRKREEGKKPRPFITISREPGIYCVPFMHELLSDLRRLDPGKPAWTGWHRELVERIALDHDLAKSLVDGLEDSGSNWVRDLLAGMATSHRHEPNDIAVYRRVSRTILALSQMGKAVIIGRGSAFITRGLPGGLHVRLAAPRNWRLRQLAERKQLDERNAEAALASLERNRRSFMRRFWPNQSLEPSNFTLTLNAAELSPAAMVRAVLSVLPISDIERAQAGGTRSMPSRAAAGSPL